MSLRPVSVQSERALGVIVRSKGDYLVAPKVRAVEACRRVLKTRDFVAEFAKLPVLLSQGAERTEAVDSTVFRKVAGHISTASPKTLQLAKRIIRMSRKLGYASWSDAFSQAFLEKDGRIKRGNMDVLIRHFHDALEKAPPEPRSRWISVAEMAELTRRSSGSP